MFSSNISMSFWMRVVSSIWSQNIEQVDGFVCLYQVTM
jgi:hypothetical protein